MPASRTFLKYWIVVKLSDMLIAFTFVAATINARVSGNSGRLMSALWKAVLIGHG